AARCGFIPEKKYGLMPPGTPYDSTVGPSAVIIRIEGTIDVAMRDYLIDAIQYAEEKGVPLIVELNTPGGLLDPAVDMVMAISDARIPVIGYVVDKWAESSGTLILMSTHIAAMQPGTIIGSLQPIRYDPATGNYEPITDSKILNPIIEILCEHGATRGRNPEALVGFVIENYNFSADEAIQVGVIEIVARDRNDLLAQLNGSIVALPSGPVVKLELNGSYEFLEPSVRIRLLHLLSDPLLSGILLSLGALALLFSIASGNLPGMAIGGFMLLLGLLGSGFNPNTASLLLILGGALLVFIELYTPGFGLVGGTGIIMLVLGIALLPVGGTGFAASEEYADTMLYTIYAVGLTIGGFTAFAVYKAVKARTMKPKLWTLEGSVGVAVDDIEPGRSEEH
ncbi:MAG TPA: nodulation protein NfeD, partial [Pyrodictium sp.]|nr:nodulation protein NfeD [Pyrodictium sp.]